MFQFAFEGALFTLNVKAPLMPVALFELPPTIRGNSAAVVRTTEPYTVLNRFVETVLDEKPQGEVSPCIPLGRLTPPEAYHKKGPRRCASPHTRARRPHGT